MPPPLGALLGQNVTIWHVAGRVWAREARCFGRFRSAFLAFRCGNGTVPGGDRTDHAPWELGPSTVTAYDQSCRHAAAPSRHHVLGLSGGANGTLRHGDGARGACATVSRPVRGWGAAGVAVGAYARGSAELVPIMVPITSTRFVRNRPIVSWDRRRDTRHVISR